MRPPACVSFTEFDSRFRSICRAFSTSVRTHTPSLVEARIRDPLPSTWGSMSAAIPSKSEARLTDRRLKVTWPASIFATFST
jgi:hypothetical protein